MWTICLVLLLASAQCGAKPTKWINSFAGPWIGYIDKLYMCSDEEMDKSLGYVDFHLRVSHWNPRKPLELQVFNGNMTLVNSTVDNDKWFVMQLDTRSNNMWKENAFRFRCPGQCCNFVRYHLPSMWRAGFGQDPKAPGPCFAKAGYYPVVNQTIDWATPVVPVMPYGHYRATLLGGLRGRELVKPGMCLRAEAHLVPRVQ